MYHPPFSTYTEFYKKTNISYLLIRTRKGKEMLVLRDILRTYQINDPLTYWLSRQLHVKVNNRNTRTKCEKCSMLKIKTPERLPKIYSKLTIQTKTTPHFPTFGLNTERHEVSLRIQPESGKIWRRSRAFLVNFGHILGRRSGVFIAKFEHISHLVLVFLLLTLNR